MNLLFWWKEKLFHPSPYWACEFLSMLGLNLTRIDNKSPQIWRNLEAVDTGLEVWLEIASKPEALRSASAGAPLKLQIDMNTEYHSFDTSRDLMVFYSLLHRGPLRYCSRLL